MTTNIIYKVYPTEISDSNNLGNRLSKSRLLLIMNILIGVVAIATIFATCYKNDQINLFPLIIGIILLVILFYRRGKYENMPDERNLETEKLFAIDDAEICTKQLHQLLNKSEEIATKILPHYESIIIKLMEEIKIDFHENAISPFWGNVEMVCDATGLFKETLNQFDLNREIYTKVLSSKKHNFPIPFPINTNITIPETTFQECKTIIRKAQTNTAFATIWEIRRNTAVNIAGFLTLSDAIYNMSDAVVSSISNLNDSIKSEFRELKISQQKYLESFSSEQELMKQTLNEMNTKLYYIQYNKVPHIPFYRPLSDI